MSGFDPTHGAHGNAVSGDTHHKGNTVHAPIPDTVVGVDGSSKRNIIRKGKKKGGHGGKKGIDIDDGSGYIEDGGALDEHDPNYDSEVNAPPLTTPYSSRPSSSPPL